MITPSSIDPRKRRAGARRYMQTVITGTVIIVAIGITALAEGNTAGAVLLLVLGPLFCGLYLVLTWASHRRFGQGSLELEETGRVLARVPAGGAVWSVERQAWTWTGGGNVPLDFGRMNASMPFVVLELAETGLILRFRLGAIGRSIGARTMSWKPADVVSIYPVRGRWLGFNRGVAIEMPTHRVSYFWTFRPEPILAALDEQGFSVSWSEHYIKLL